MANIRNEKHQLNQQIEVMVCNWWQFQELHRLCQELKQVRRLRGNEQEEDRGTQDEDNRIRLNPKGKEEALGRHWQEILKIQPEDNIEFDELNEQIVNQHIRQHQEEFKEKKQNNLTD